MNLSLDIELVDATPYAEAHPSKYWFLLVVMMADKGLCKWVEDGEVIRAYIPKAAVEALVESHWIKQPDKADKALKKSKTYLMRDARNGLIKIGRSYSPTVRERTLQSESPSIELVAVCEDNVEAELHTKYSQCRVRGEWFKLDTIALSSIIQRHNFTEI